MALGRSAGCIAVPSASRDGRDSRHFPMSARPSPPLARKDIASRSEELTDLRHKRRADQEARSDRALAQRLVISQSDHSPADVFAVCTQHSRQQQ